MPWSDIAMRFAENIGMKLETYHSAHHICTHYVDIMSKHFIQTWSGIEISGEKKDILIFLADKDRFMPEYN